MPRELEKLLTELALKSKQIRDSRARSEWRPVLRRRCRWSGCSLCVGRRRRVSRSGSAAAAAGRSSMSRCRATRRTTAASRSCGCGTAPDFGGSAGRRRRLPWSHDYPDGEVHFTKILKELTLLRLRDGRVEHPGARRSGAVQLSGRLHGGAGLLGDDADGGDGASQLPAQGRAS